MANEYSVYQFFSEDAGGTHERVRSFVSGDEALKAAQFYSNNVAAKMGITDRVIITDGGDLIAWEWQRGKGIVWPEPTTHTQAPETPKHAQDGPSHEIEP